MVEFSQIDNLVADRLLQIVDAFSGFVPSEYEMFFTFGLFLVLIVLYSIFVWNFYRFLAKRDLLELNLKKYQNGQDSLKNQVFAALLFIFEFIIILPIVVFFWFVVMALLLLFMAKEIDPTNVLLVTACIVGAVRVTAYYSEDLSRDLAKMFPFTILAIALVTPGFFVFKGVVDRITDIGTLFNHILFYLLAIMALEFILRMFYLISSENSAEAV